MTEVVALVCTLPIRHKKYPHKSITDVVRMLNLDKHRSEVNSERIVSYLKENRHLLEIWSRWSEDKRSSPSWYFAKSGQTWVVGKFPGGPEFVFEDPVQACARFVEMELDELLADL